MTESTPPFSAYPGKQGAATYDTLEKFESLGIAYFELVWVFIANTVLNIATCYMLRQHSYLLVSMLSIQFGLVASLSYSANQRIATVMRWNSNAAFILSLVMGANAAFFSGAIGYALMMGIATKEMRKYGLRSTLFVTKRDYLSAVQALKQGTSQLPVDLPRHPSW